MSATPSSPVEPTREELARAARSGGVWALAQSVVSKATSAIGQLLLAWFLVEGDMGLVATAVSISALLLFFNPPLMADVLLQHKETFDRDAPTAFWLTVAIAALTSLVMAACAPIVAAAYGNPQLVGLLLVGAMMPLGSALQVASLAKLRIALELGRIAKLSIVLSVATTATSVALAALGFGAYSIALPAALVTFAAAFAFARSARTMTGGRASRAAPVRGLARAYATVCAGQYAHTLGLFADYLALSLFATVDELGFYYFAFRLSAQLNGLLTYNTSLALQPVLSHLGRDVASQTRAFLRATEAVAIVSTPLCLLQAALAAPAIRLLFEARWLPAVPILAVLSLAQACSATVGVTQAALKAQTRFGTYWRWQFVQALVLVPVLFLCAGAVGPWLERAFDVPEARALATAAGLSLVAAVSVPVGIWLAVRGRGGRRRDVARVFALPFLIGAPGAAVAWGIAAVLPETRVGSLLAVALGTLAGLALTCALARLIAPGIVTTLRSLLPRRR